MINKRIITLFMTIVTLLTINQQPILSKHEEPTILSKTAIVIEANTGTVLYEKNSTKKSYPASLTKLLTALLVIETLSKDDTVTFSETAINSVQSGGSSIGIRPSETLTIDDALHGLLLMSANEIANGLAEEVSGSIDNFVSTMNQRAIELGAFDTHFVNPHGLFQDDHTTTAYDLALITLELIKHNYFLSIMNDSFYEISPTNIMDETRYLYQQHKMVNTKNDMRIFREDVIAGKVGYTSESGFTLVTVAEQGDKTLIVVILDSDSTERYTDTATLLDYCFEINIDPSIYSLPVRESILNTITPLNQHLNDNLLHSISLPSKEKGHSNDMTSIVNTNTNRMNPLLYLGIIFLIVSFLYYLSKRKINRLRKDYFSSHSKE